MSKASDKSKQQKAKPDTPTRIYFVPSALKSVEASSPAEAVEKANKKVKVGDGNR